MPSFLNSNVDDAEKAECEDQKNLKEPASSSSIIIQKMTKEEMQVLEENKRPKDQSIRQSKHVSSKRKLSEAQSEELAVLITLKNRKTTAGAN